ncbi:unnamed protein product [Angiostrongylus costaricensis]|uniref:GLOBIN domain-containing protein n=1 Tax=Angiostrongylus costaricensis TaxID=334426 RepID=A0A0R3P9U6_ANGCS|nr:unnamed protein product [Angiostrongylus costaricensis]
MRGEEAMYPMATKQNALGTDHMLQSSFVMNDDETVSVNGNSRKTGNIIGLDDVGVTAINILPKMLSPADVKKHVRASLKSVPVGKSPAELQNGKDFYKFFFTNYPDLRRYFKGAENFTAEDVQKSERFQNQGQRLLLAVHLLADTFDDEATFRAYARETINRHRIFKMDPVLWSVSIHTSFAFSV